MKKKKTVFLVATICLFIFIAAAFYWYQKPRETSADQKPDHTVSATELFSAFQKDEKKANEQYVGKVILVSGTLESVAFSDSTASVLVSAGNEMGGINCSIIKGGNVKFLQKGTAIKVKGRCTGFLVDVNLVDAVVEK